MLRFRLLAADAPSQSVRSNTRTKQDDAFDQQPELRARREVREVEVAERDHQPEGGRVDERARVAPERALDENDREDEDRQVADPRLDESPETRRRP